MNLSKFRIGIMQNLYHETSRPLAELMKSDSAIAQRSTSKRSRHNETGQRPETEDIEVNPSSRQLLLKGLQQNWSSRFMSSLILYSSQHIQLLFLV